MAFANLGFETEGSTTGSADGWTYIFLAQRQVIADIDPDPRRPQEDFERDWDVDDYEIRFADADLTAAVYDSLISAEFSEDFEEGWSSNQNFLFDLLGIVAATFDVGAPESVEDFEEEWLSNQNFIFALGSTVVAAFDVGTPQDFEDFEEEWRSNENFLSAFSGGDITAASFDAGGTPEDVEDFEEFLADIEFTPIDSNDRLDAPSHGFNDDDRIFLRSDGTLPPGLSSKIKYFVIDDTGGSLRVALTLGGTQISFDGVGIGPHFFKHDTAAFWTYAMETI